MKITTNPLKKKFWSGLPVLLFALLAMPSVCSAQIAVEYGTLESGTRFVDLLPNTPNQLVEFFASGIAGSGASALELDIQVGDGGAAAGGSDVVPEISSIDLLTDTIFTGGAFQANNPGGGPLVMQSTVDQPGELTSDGLIATVEFDTTGISIGDVDLLLTGVFGGQFNTSFSNTGGVNVDTLAPSGVIRIRPDVVPEPTSVVLVAGIGLAGLVRRRRRQIA